MCFSAGIVASMCCPNEAWNPGSKVILLTKVPKGPIRMLNLFPVLNEWICSHTGMFVCKKAFLKRESESKRFNTCSKWLWGPLLPLPCLTGRLQLELYCRFSNSLSLTFSFNQQPTMLLFCTMSDALCRCLQINRGEKEGTFILFMTKMNLFCLSKFHCRNEWKFQPCTISLPLPRGSCDCQRLSFCSQNNFRKLQRRFLWKFQEM